MKAFKKVIKKIINVIHVLYNGSQSRDYSRLSIPAERYWQYGYSPYLYSSIYSGHQIWW